MMRRLCFTKNVGCLYKKWMLTGYSRLHSYRHLRQGINSQWIVELCLFHVFPLSSDNFPLLYSITAIKCQTLNFARCTKCYDTVRFRCNKILIHFTDRLHVLRQAVFVFISISVLFRNDMLLFIQNPENVSEYTFISFSIPYPIRGIPTRHNQFQRVTIQHR